MKIDYEDKYCPVCWVDNYEAVLLDTVEDGLFQCRKFPKHYKASNPRDTYNFKMKAKQSSRS